MLFDPKSRFMNFDPFDFIKLLLIQLLDVRIRLSFFQFFYK